MTCSLALDRTPDFPGAMQVELIDSPGFSAEKVEIAMGATSAVVKVRLDKSALRQIDPVLHFRATGKLPSGVAVVSETTIAVKFATAIAPK